MNKKKSMIRLSTHAIDNPTVVGQDKVVTLHYTLESADKSLKEIADETRPFHYLHGSPMLIGSIQDAIEGKSKGDKVSLRLPPENAYGRKDPALVQSVEATVFDEDEEIEVGMMYFQDLEEGRRLATIKSIEGNEILIDGNHPFAGHILKIDIDIVDIREATEAEITNRMVLH